MLHKIQFQDGKDQTITVDAYSLRDPFYEVEPGVEIGFLPRLNPGNGNGYILMRQCQKVTLLEEINVNLSQFLLEMSDDERLNYFRTTLAEKAKT